MKKTYTLSKKNDWNRRGRSFIRHALLLLWPLIIATGVVLVWYQLRLRGYHFSHADESALVGAVIMTFAVLFSITGAFVLNTIWEKYRMVVLCIFQKDKERFLFYRDERIPVLLHLLLFSFSFPLLGMIAMLDYKEVLSGMIAVFSVSFGLSLYWIAAVELENPVNSPWIKERIPKEWLTVDVDEQFALGTEGKRHTKDVVE